MLVKLTDHVTGQVGTNFHNFAVQRGREFFQYLIRSGHELETQSKAACDFGGA